MSPRGLAANAERLSFGIGKGMARVVAARAGCRSIQGEFLVEKETFAELNAFRNEGIVAGQIRPRKRRAHLESVGLEGLGQIDRR